MFILMFYTAVCQFIIKERMMMVILVAGGRNKSLNSPSPNLQEIEQVASLKILGVTISNKLIVSEHVQQTDSRCAQSFHALGI